MNATQISLLLWILVGLIVGGLAGFLISRVNGLPAVRTYVPDWKSALIGLVLGAGVVGLVVIVLVALGSVPVGCEAASTSGGGQTPATSQPDAPPDPILVAQLESDAKDYLTQAKCLVRFNSTLDIWLKIGAIATAFLTTIASQQKWTFVGVASGALVTALTGAQAAFPLGNLASFYRGIEARTDRVLSDVRLGQLDMTGFEAARVRLEDIKADGARGPNTAGVSTPAPTSTPKPPGG